jgi:hypothetical protein
MHTEQVIFIHIPKAAGRTMHSIVARQYRRHEILAINQWHAQTRSLSLEDAERAKIIIGLLHYGLHQELRGASTYVTLLREPVGRVLSLYRYIVTNRRHYLHEQVASMPLIDFVTGQADVEEIENGQTRQIAGVTEGSPDASSLVRAKQNLAREFAVVGLVERFDESIVLMKRRLGWKMPFYVRKNVTQTPLAEDPTEEALEVIRGRNALDIELYRFGSDLFEEQIGREGPLFDVEVSLFQTLNAAARAYQGGREWARSMRGGNA